MSINIFKFNCGFVGIFGIGGGKGIGSGTIIDKDGTILTCAHAVVDFRGQKIASKGKVYSSFVISFSSPYSCCQVNVFW